MWNKIKIKIKLLLFGNEPKFHCQMEDSRHLAIGHVVLRGVRRPAVVRFGDLKVLRPGVRVDLPEMRDIAEWNGARWV